MHQVELLLGQYFLEMSLPRLFQQVVDSIQRRLGDQPDAQFKLLLQSSQLHQANADLNSIQESLKGDSSPDAVLLLGKAFRVTPVEWEH